jgi:putative transposase
LPKRFSHLSLDAWVVMPDHVHGILMIDQVGLTPDPSPDLPDTPPAGAPVGSLGAIIGAYKSTTTQRINRIRGTAGRQVWQRNYYEHIIRSGAELDAIRRYIHDNPLNWPLDKHHPPIPGA